MNPCRKCESRHQGCHANCIEYDKFREVIAKVKDLRKKDEEVIAFLNKGERRKKHW